ncbi:MAG TPA: 16S rRNA (guanine(966)-N(2))-methyltransferase RsmD [Myxococcota bacterium]|nr:16S rRNA (guanine(966)-N(2))-methyltransferase RsmD [Myxococcota bacterium]
MRVIAGRLGGRRLRPPPDAGVRPTSDRVREALFAQLGVLEDARVLDLYAGTGALGIEALSRGALAATFVERSPASLAVLRDNLGRLALEAQSRIMRGDALAVVRRLGRSAERFDLVLADPPYALEVGPALLTALRAAQIVVLGGTVVIESSRRHPVQPVPGWRVVSDRRYGDTGVTRLTPDPEVGIGTQGAGPARAPGGGKAEE